MSKGSERGGRRGPGTPKVSRRTTLKALGTAAVAAALSDCRTPNPDHDLEDWDLIRERIDTIVVLVMENRSFDHYYGALSLEEGRDDVEGLTPEMSNPHPDGYDVPIKPAEVDCVDDPPHSWDASHDQFNDGAMDGFVSEYVDDTTAERVPEVMGYWNRDMLPTLYAMADLFTICDHWFCSVMSSTWPNRFYAQAAQSGGETGNDMPAEAFDSIYTRFEQADLEWGVFYGNLPSAALMPDTATDPAMVPIESFFERAAEGTLPPLCWVEPVYGRNDDHPPEHPLAGQIFIQSIYEALASSPQWDRTLFVVTYDEHGGFFDHVAPPTTADDRSDEGFDQLGFRVPTAIVGPWVKPGYVSKVVYDHTSWIAFATKLFGLEPLTARDAAADPMLDVFDLDAMRNNAPLAGPQLPVIEADDDVLYRDECDPVQALAARTYAGPDTHQPEMDLYADLHLRGTPLDRRDEGDEIYAWLLTWAQAHGVLRRP